jgi:predicted ester cyclase
VEKKTASAGTYPAVEKNKDLAHRWHMDMFLKDNWGLADEILTSDFVMHLPGMGDVKGIQDAKNVASALRAGGSNMKINHYETVADGDYVLVRWDFSYDHTGAMLGVPATNKRVSGVTGMDLFRFRNGKIAEFWQNADWLGAMQQMGAIPSQ